MSPRPLLPCLLLALLPLCGHAAADTLNFFERQDCALFGQVFLRIAQLRDGGASQTLAVHNAADFLTKSGQTGSHLRGKDYRPSAPRFTAYVYARPQMDPALLYIHGLHQCTLAKQPLSDAEFDAAVAELDAVTTRCMAAHPGEGERKALGQCLQAAFSAPAKPER